MHRRDWTGAQVRGALKARGVTLAQVARSARKSFSHVSRVVHGEARSAKVEKIVAQKIGLPLSVIYPSRVNADVFSTGGRGETSYEGAAAGRRFGTWGAQNRELPCAPCFVLLTSSMVMSSGWCGHRWCGHRRRNGCSG